MQRQLMLWMATHRLVDLAGAKVVAALEREDRALRSGQALGHGRRIGGVALHAYADICTACTCMERMHEILHSEVT